MDPTPEATPSFNTVEAAVSLLGDLDKKVADACRLRVLAWGNLSRPALLRAIREGEPRLRARARMVLRTLELRDWQAAVLRYADTLRRRRSRRGARHERRADADLAEGALLVSSLLRAGQVDRTQLFDFVEEQAAVVGPRLLGKTSATGARLLADQLARGAGLASENASLYEPESALVDAVVANKRGVPAALGILYLLVARRSGLEASGVVLPEHFLVRVHGGRAVLLDPAHEGRHVTKADCMRYLRLSGHGIHAVSYLEDASDAAVLGTLLRALHCVFGYREDREVCIAIEAARKALLGPE